LCQFAWWVAEITAQGALRGHRDLMSWLRDTGERSRADGLRALAAVGYLSMSFAVFVLIILRSLLAVIT
jgi:hypothetical protein